MPPGTWYRRGCHEVYSDGSQQMGGVQGKLVINGGFGMPRNSRYANRDTADIIGGIAMILWARDSKAVSPVRVVEPQLRWTGCRPVRVLP